eukprot:5344093-Amphidinium_carterae.1
MDQTACKMRHFCPQPLDTRNLVPCCIELFPIRAIRASLQKFPFKLATCVHTAQLCSVRLEIGSNEGKVFGVILSYPFFCRVHQLNMQPLGTYGHPRSRHDT